MINQIKIIEKLSICFQKKMDQPLTMMSMDSSSGVMLPYYDYDNRVVYIAGKVKLNVNK